MSSYHIITEGTKKKIFSGSGETVRDIIHEQVNEVYNKIKENKYIKLGTIEPVDMIVKDIVEYQLVLNYRLKKEQDMINKAKKMYRKLM